MADVGALPELLVAVGWELSLALESVGGGAW